MSQSARHQAFLAAVSGVIFFVQLGATRLWDVDEAIFEMPKEEAPAKSDDEKKADK